VFANVRYGSFKFQHNTVCLFEPFVALCNESQMPNSHGIPANQRLYRRFMMIMYARAAMLCLRNMILVGEMDEDMKTVQLRQSAVLLHG